MSKSPEMKQIGKSSKLFLYRNKEQGPSIFLDLCGTIFNHRDLHCENLLYGFIFILIRTGLGRRLSSEAFNVMTVVRLPSPLKTYDYVRAVGKKNSESLSLITVVEQRPYQNQGSAVVAKAVLWTSWQSPAAP